MEQIEQPAEPTEAPADVGEGPAVQVILRYEDGSPMADAEWTGVFGDRSVAGRTDEQGSATISRPPPARRPRRPPAPAEPGP
jgi:hypothetical protein